MPHRGVGTIDSAVEKAYVPALDGVRAFAVAAVLLFHGGVTWAPGGFLGVDVFFVLSGFLITSLLVGEFERTGKLALVRFWARRARRLLPALLAMLLLVSLYALWLAPAGSLGEIRGEAISTLFYFANWNQISSGQSYFTALQSASPLLHTWSLAIEEQFYLLWPLIVLALMRLGRSRTVLLAFSCAGAVASAVAMAVMYQNGLGVNRVYYGTDTRAQDLLIGAALALILAGARPARAGASRRRPLHSSRVGGTSRAATALFVVAGGIGLGFVCYAVTGAESTSAWLYAGGFGAVSLGTAALLACITLVPTSPWARLFSLSPVRYLGRISYGLYLWHWPLFVMLDTARTGLAGWQLLGVRLGVTLGVSVASYHLLEMPIRRGALRRWRVKLLTPAAIGATAASVLLATAGASAAAATPVIPANVYAIGPNISPGVTPLIPSVPASTGGPVRMLFVGSSEAVFMTFGLAPGAEIYGIDFQNDAVTNCGLLQLPTLFHGQPANMLLGFRGAISAANAVRCSTQLERWKNDVDTFHPDVVVLEEGALEVRGHLVNGNWEYLGQPALDGLEVRALEQSVSVLGSTGATVVLLSAPYYRSTPPQPDGKPWPEDNPALVDTFNRLLAQVAALHPGRVVVEPLGAKLDPGGRFAATIDSQPMRLDGIHASIAAGHYVQPWLLPRIYTLGQQARAREARLAAANKP